LPAQLFRFSSLLDQLECRGAHLTQETLPHRQSKGARASGQTFDGELFKLRDMTGCVGVESMTAVWLIKRFLD
jgi:hypothetical protein